MKVSEAFPEDSIECRECGRTFTGHFNKQHDWVSKWKVLAGHIMASRDHYDKEWAKRFLGGAGVGFEAWGNEPWSARRYSHSYSRWY